MAKGDQYYGVLNLVGSTSTHTRQFKVGLDNYSQGTAQDGYTWSVPIYNTVGGNTTTTYTITGAGTSINSMGGQVITGDASLYDANGYLVSASGSMTFTWGSFSSTGFFVFSGAGVFKVPQPFGAGEVQIGGVNSTGVGFVEQ